MRWIWIAMALRLQAVVGQCGVAVGKTKIVGGQSVPSLKYPWFVALVAAPGGPSFSVSCGGSLITNRHVLTAAHCFPPSQGMPPEKLYRAVFQLVDRCTQTDAETSALSRVDIYPSFDSQTLHGDVAIATLQRTVQYTPICLPARNSKTIGDAYIIGFGSMLVKSQYPCILQEAQITIFSRRQCARSGLASDFSKIPGTFCAGLLKGGVDSCDGDSGGPLQTIGSGGIYTIQGIVSFGEGCARKNLPGVYTEVSAFRDFIDKVVHRRRRRKNKRVHK